MNKPSQAAIGLAEAQDPILIYAMQYLGDHGFDMPRDGRLAREWCEAQAMSGITDAKVVYGVLQSLGLFGSDDPDAGRSWIQSAADEGHPTALLMLAGFVEAGSDSATANAQHAVELVQSAAEKGYAPALVEMGLRYLEGINVEKDRDHSLKYLRMAAELGDHMGQYLLGVNLLHDENAQVIKEGINWLKLSASNGYAGAHRHLGYLYGDGSRGLTQDEAKSRYHFEMAMKIEESARALLL